MSDDPDYKGLDEHERAKTCGPGNAGAKRGRLKNIAWPLSLLVLSESGGEILNHYSEEESDRKAEIGELHVPEERYPDDPGDDSPGVYSAGGSQGGDRIIIPFRMNLAVDYFRPIRSNYGKISFKLIGNCIKKGMVRELDKVKGIKAVELDKVLKDKLCSREDIVRDPEALYRICGQNGILEGCYELDEMFPGDPYDRRDGIRIFSRLTYWDSGKYIDSRSYTVSGGVRELDKLFTELTDIIRRDMLPPVTHPCNINPARQMANKNFFSRESPRAASA